MKQLFSRQIRRLISFLVLLLILIVTGLTFMQRTTQVPMILLTTPAQIITPVYPYLNNSNAVKLTFLNSRPFYMHLLSNDIVSNSIARSRSWMSHQTKLISLMLANSSSKPAVFLDIGANIGWFTLVMSVLGHKVIAIEPMLNNVKLMQASLQASQTSHNVIVHPNGLGVIPQQCILYSDNGNIGDGHTICGISSEKNINTLIPNGYSIRQIINSTRLDTLVSQNIDVMKIDVEGSELYAVQSGNHLFDHYHVHNIISEFSPRMMRDKKSDPYEYLKFFISRGYNIRMVNDQLASLYEQNTWQTVTVYKSEQDLRRLCDGSGEMELWFTKN
ncbi:unnamed protein product [Adineta steineri]|uniref:Methyltransferase FkbM domain-containing protein n=1 Tax=Adineta steineri TaxID=433720 RepID=A0A814QPW2_9BILA|nr:unnamed protein product [Adineta steineri]CAF1123042.1 unnamed protein product [Adineta steineri]CAF4011128.1 unnamed protein product [Adineta steineri]CAF4159212.1 unnamed protein product [Adineta steineri]